MTATATVRVTNIAPQATRDQMHKLFGFIGKIDDIRLYPTVRDVAVPVLSRVSFVRFSDAHLTDVALHMTNTVFIDRALVVMPHHGAIPDELAALETLRRDNGLIGTLNDGELPAHVTNVVEGAYYITRDPSFAENGVPDYPDLACTLEYGEVEEIRRTIVIGNLPPDTETSKLVKFMATAGEVKYARMCGQSTDETRACLLEFSEQTAILPALKMAGTTFRGRALTMAHSRVPILKPQIKTNEMAQREIEEAMRRAQEQQTLMTASVQPQVPYLEPKRRSRSRSRSHRLSSRSDSYRSKRRSRSRERGRRSRSRDRKRSRSRDRKRSRSRERKRSRSRDRKRSRSRERKRSRSRDRKRSRSRDGKYSRSRDKKRSRSRDRRERGKSRRSRSKEKRSHSSRDKRESRAHSRDDVASGDAAAAPVGDIDQCVNKSGADHAATRRSRSPPSAAHRKQSRRSRSRSRGHRKSRSPAASAKRYSRSSAEPRKPERRSSRERREKSGATDRRVVRDYDEEEQGYDDQVAGADSPQDSPPPAKASRHSRSLAASKSRADDMDMSD